MLFVRGRACLLAVLAIALARLSDSGFAQNPSGDLRIEVIAAYNLVVDSNVESPSTYAPRSAYLGAKIWNDGPNDITNAFAYIGNFASNTPGIYPPRAQLPHLGPLTTNMFALTHEGGSAGTADATRSLGTIPAGGYVPVYWLISYPNVGTNGAAVWGPSVKPDDDLWLNYDIWATAKDEDVDRTASVTRKVTMRNEISSSANKIFPNTASKVPQAYLDLLNQYQPSWTNLYSDGTPGTRIWTEGVWYDLGNVSGGFDNNGDLVPDRNAWLQPVGDPTTFDAGAFRLVQSYAMVVVKLKTGGEQVYMVNDQLYFENLPENNGVIGLVRYDFLPLKSGASSQLSPYQEAASGNDNEKFNGDYGAMLGNGLSSGTSKVEMNKTVDAAVSWPGSNLLYRISFTNSGTVAVGDPALNMPLVVQDSIPTGTFYVAGSATNSNVLPTGVTAYVVLFTTNRGTSWVNYEPSPATNVTGIQWWLSNSLNTNAAGSVAFRVTVTNPYTFSPLIVNVGALSFGNSSPFLQTNAYTIVQGTNSLGDRVFKDDATGGGTFGNGLQDGTEPGISNVTVYLYYDGNSNGVVDSSDLPLTNAVTSTNGTYMFTNLFNGPYISKVDLTSSNIPFGYTTTTSSYYSVILGGAIAAYTNADFGFAPALTFSKGLVGSSPVRESSNVTFSITVTNRLAGNGGGSEYIVWSTNLVAGSKWDYPSNAIGAPDLVYASAPLATSKKETIELNGLSLSAQNGTVRKVEMYIPIVVSPINPADNVDFSLREGATELFTTNKTVGSLTSGMFIVDVTGVRSWTWDGLAATNTLAIRLVSNKDGAGGSTCLVDSVGMRITSDWSGTNDAVRTLNPVPLTDTYNASNLQFVSASITPQTTNVTGSAGTLYWSNIGPVYPGTSTTVTVTFKALEPLSGAASNIVTNTASVTTATYGNGTPANTATSSATVVVLPAGTIGDYVWWDLNTNGTKEAYEGGIPGVSVVLFSTNIVGRRTNVTDYTGYYLFEGLPSNGTYTVYVLTNTIGGAITNVYNAGAAAHVSSNAFSLTNLGDIDYADFGYRYSNASNIIDGTIWNDINRNGASLPDSGEPWLTNVTVYLYTNLSSAAIATNRTSTNGYFRFAGNYSTNLNYFVVVSNNTGMMTNLLWTQTYDTDWPSTTNYVSFALPTNGYKRVDFSYYQRGAYIIGDTLFYDWNGDGTQQANEEGVIGVPVSLYFDVNSNRTYDAATDRLVATNTTGAGGYYTFTNLLPSNYLVIVDTTSTNMPTLYQITADPYGANDARSALTISTASNLLQDFGFQPYGTGTIGDVVWRDMNGDGAKSGYTETGITNVLVMLYVDLNRDGAYSLVSSQRTDSAGAYLFSSLPDARYNVVVYTNDAAIPADPFSMRYPPTTSTNYSVTISNGSTYLQADFGFMPLGAIGDAIFWDANTNGLQDWNEDGVSNVTVSLYRDLNSNGLYDTGETFVTNRVTDTNGLYLFTGITTGRYVVVVTTNSGPLSGTQCSSDPNGDGVAFSNCNSEVGVTVIPGTRFMGADFGYVPTGIIGDSVWIDTDNDGVRDANESGISYITVEARTNGVVYATEETDADGYYFFVRLPNTTYSVVVLTNDVDFPSGLAPTFDADKTFDNQTTSIVVSAGYITQIGGTATNNADLKVDFGYRYSGAYTLSGTVGMDGSPTNGVLGTGANGVSVDESPFPNVTVYLTFWSDDGDDTMESGETRIIASTTTSNNGDYAFSNLPTGDGNDRYIVSLSAPDTYLWLTTSNGLTPAAWVSNTVDAAGYSVSSFQVITNLVPVTTNIDFAYRTPVQYDFGDMPSTYGTLVSDTPTGPRHKVKFNPDLFLGLWVDTESDGQPTSDASRDGDDEDGVAPIGAWQAGATGQVNVLVGSGTGWLVGYVDFNTNGSFTDAGEMIISQAVSNSAGGIYTNSFAVPSSAVVPTNTTSLYARFRLFPSQPAFPALAYSGKADNGEVEDYFFQFGSIGDRVWVDANSNQVQDAGEPGLAGVTVFLDINGDGVHQTNGEPYAVTDANGYYGIGGLCTGTYTVVVLTNSFPNTSLYQTYDLDWPGTTNKASVSITNIGQVVTNADFGYVVQPIDLVLTKAVDSTNSLITTNGGCWFTITVTNNGPTAAIGCVVTDQWPSVLSYTNHWSTKGTYDSTTRLWTIGTLAPGSGAMLVITGLTHYVAQGTTITNTAWVWSSSYETNMNNNTGGVSVTTLAVLSRLEAYEDGGSVVVEWETASEVGTAGFYLYRIGADRSRIRINSRLLASVPGVHQGSVYRLADKGATPGRVCEYELEEIESGGRLNVYGPFKVLVRKSSSLRQTVSSVQSFQPMVQPRRSADKLMRVSSGMTVDASGGGSPEVVASAKPGTSARVKIAVRERGVYFVDASLLTGPMGLTVDDASRLIRTGGLALSCGGQPVAYLPREDGAGIYFFGEASKSRFSSNNFYWIEAGRGKAIGSMDPAAGPSPVVETQSYSVTKHLEQSKYAVTALSTDPSTDFWMWEYLFAGDPDTGTRKFSAGLDGVSASGGQCSLVVCMQGATSTGVENEHSAIIKLNGVEIGRTRWTGAKASQATLAFEQDILVDGNNEIEVVAEVVPGVPYSIFYVNSFDLTYRRKYEARVGQLMVRGDGNQAVTVGGFGSGTIMVLDIGKPDTPRLVSGVTVDSYGGTFRATFTPSDAVTEYAVFASGMNPVSVVFGGGGLRWAGNSADYVVITTPELATAAKALADYRGSKGLVSKVVALPDIYDDFSCGVPDPAAISAFIAYARSNWIMGPRYVLLAGDGTYDYQNYLGCGDNIVPALLVSTPQGVFASDSVHGDLNGDGVPEVAIGRLPVMNAAELQAQVQKIIAYESVAGGDWQKQVILSADKPVEYGDFVAASEKLAGILPAGNSANRVYLPAYASLADARTALAGYVNSGALLMNYYGHAGMDRLSQQGLLTTADVAGLTNGNKLPILTAMSCVIGRFEVPGYDCLAESLVLRQGGGAVAVWAPSGLSRDEDAHVLAELFYGDVAGNRTPVLGDAIMRSLAGYRAQFRTRYMLGIYNLTGDPALLISGMPLSRTVYGESEATVDSADKWKKLHFSAQELIDEAIAGDKADPDGDGILNLFEYAQGRNPRRADGGPVFEFGEIQNGGTGYDAEIRFKRRKLAADLLWHVEVSADIKTWIEGAGVVAEAGVTDDGNGVTETAMYRIKSPAPDGSRAFVRLRIERTK